MPRGKKGTYALAEDGDGRLTPVRADGDSGGLQDVSGVQVTGEWSGLALQALADFDARTDGWFRYIPTGDGKQCYAKWKFTSGPHKMKYVMYAAPAGAWAQAVGGLNLKLDQVDNGLLRPALDTFYDPR